MREVILEMGDLSDSREVMEKKIPRSTTVFITIILLAIGIALIWAYFGKVEKYVACAGEIRPKTLHTLTALSGGQIESKYFDNGDTVQTGDVLLEFDGALLNRQKEALEVQIADVSFKIECCEKLIQLIRNNRNLLSRSGAEAQYYYQFENYRLQREKLETNDGTDHGQEKEQLKATFYSSAADTKDTHITQRETLKTELLTLEHSIKESVIIAAADGVIEWTQPIQAGDTLAPGTELGTIVPASMEMQVILNVAEGDIASIKIGQKVGYRINSVSLKEFDKLSGEIVKIYSDAFVAGDVNQGNGQKYYRVEATLSSSVLTNKQNETRQLLAGMSMQAHVINGQQSILDWVLSKIGFT